MKSTQSIRERAIKWIGGNLMPSFSKGKTDYFDFTQDTLATQLIWFAQSETQSLLQERDRLAIENEKMQTAISAVLRYISSNQVYDKDARGILTRSLPSVETDAKHPVESGGGEDE